MLLLSGRVIVRGKSGVSVMTAQTEVLEDQVIVILLLEYLID